MNPDIQSVLLTEEQIQQGIARLAQQINTDFGLTQGQSLTVICVLRGSVLFFSDLIQKLCGDIRLEFLNASSYGMSDVSSGSVNVNYASNFEVENKNVLIVEDIVDTGCSLDALTKLIKSRQPAQVKTVCLLDKPSRRKIEIQADYTGFVIPDEFVVGYGMDFAQRYRNLPYIGILKKSVYQK